MIRDIPGALTYLNEQIRAQVDIAVVGLSGGADSTLTAILASQALGRENAYGISMPYNRTDAATFNAASADMAGRIDIHHFYRPVSAIADAINDQVFLYEPEELTDINKGNARSRARMCVLYGIAHNLCSQFPAKRIRVLGTGNLSEDFIGYDTKGGDALADIFPIGELFKSEVYQLLDYFRGQGTIDEAHINRTPSAGLQKNQTDESDLGYSYDAMEQSIRFCLKHYHEMAQQDLDPITAFVWQRHLAHKHKHEAPVVLRLRHFCD